MRSIILGASLAVLAATSATAAPTRKPVHERHPGTAEGKTKSATQMPDISAMFAVFDKLFPPQPAPDPARLALAQTSAAAIWPTGAYGNMMVGMMSTMVDNALTMKASDIPGMAKAGKAGEANLSLHDQAAAKDPYFDQRLAAIKDVMNEEAGKVSAIIDPRIRDGLARSMARRFDARQLADINAFFATPSGHALASQYMQMWVDPDVMRGIFGSMPQMMTLMPDALQKLKAATDKFPPPPKSSSSAAASKS